MNLDVSTIISNSQKLDVISFEECDMPHFVIDKAFIKEYLSIRKNATTLNWYSKEKVTEKGPMLFVLKYLVITFTFIESSSVLL